MHDKADGLTPVYLLPIEQGANFAYTFQWLSGGVFMAPIELLEEGYPTIITVTGHGLNTVSDHPVIISGVQGIEHINAVDTEIAICTRLDENRISVPRSSVGQYWEVGTGEITYLKPTDLTGMTARCTIRKNWHSDTFIHQMTTENGGITLGLQDASIQLTIDKADTAAFNFKNAVYDLEMITAGGYETRLFKGPVKLFRDY